ncbi:hypothetical protein BM51_0962 [Streptococcus pneumoniae]|nr:hypothetical protein BM51_0962 [Streptococcus pneumoniae]KGI35904.1 hypothetical protein X231_0326 [Streptococcus pneumoniae ECC_3510]
MHHCLSFDIILLPNVLIVKVFLKKEGYEKWTTNELMNI